MTISGLETLRLGQFPNLLFVRIYTSDGRCGLGETYYGSAAVAAHIHEMVVPALLGRAEGQIESLHDSLTGYVGYLGTGVETRALAAVDTALWDLAGQRAGLPLVDLLGRARDHVPVYNTCAGSRYMREPQGQQIGNWGLSGEVAQGRYEDLDAFLHRADELAHDLLSTGVTSMKIWPLDALAEASGGRRVPSGAELRAALAPVERIRRAVGDQMNILIEMHGLWAPDAASVIVHALEEFKPAWIEDPIRPDDTAGLARLAGETQIPLAVGETLGGIRAFAALLRADAVGVAITDIGWVGGITEALRLAEVTHRQGIPLALHDCGGPVVLAASAHLATHLPNVFIQETTRAYYHGWYQELVTGLPVLCEGSLSPGTEPGLGIRLRDGLEQRPDAIRVTAGTCPAN